MILHLTLGTTHIPLEINADDGAEPRLTVVQAGVLSPTPVSVPARRQRQQLLAMAAVGLVCGFAGYRLALGRGDAAVAAQTLAQVAPERLVPALPVETAGIPPQLRRELAGQPIVSRPPPSAAAPRAGDANPFGLE